MILTKTEKRVAAEFRRLTEVSTQVECDVCDAPVGDVCVVQDVALLVPHMSRFMAAMELVMRAERRSA